MALSAGTRRTLACLLVGIGALLIIAAILIPTFTVSKLAKTPLDLEITTVGKNPADVASEVLDAKSLTSGTGPAKIDTKVPLISQRFLTVEDPSDKNKMTIQNGQTLRRIDKQGDTGLLSAIIDRVTIDRKSGMPVDTDPNGSIAANVDAKGNSVADPVQHTGLEYRFPIGTEKKTYPYFDSNTRKSYDMEFIEQSEINNTKVYHFRQQVPATDLSKVVNSPTNKLTLPAEKWGVDEDGDVTMSRFYSNTRDVWVEPQTGTIIDGSEALYYFYARSGDKPEVTALKSTLKFDDNTIDSQIKVAKDNIDKLSLYSRILPIVFGILGALALIGGVLLGLLGGRGRPATIGRHSPRPDPADSYSADAYSDAPTQQIDLRDQR
ncbi:DUF3068 domain-containing protein [Nocardia sp. alder85J]|uniref:DUF3068 domain-containing protein n=1 Tax=Nocardia sp. alder85J TaxID=2862949 RepID=UPI001CD34622|nr:DUF3068 domain-containing protein [Nocardia sp. alder85J]MCX4096316.1 DUF3068 domain-containing protein [Nocardia sp. alder85J]